MTTKIRYGLANIDLMGAAEGAVRRFEYVRPECTTEFAELMAKDFNAFCTRAAPLRKNPHLLTRKAYEEMPHAIKVLQGYVSFQVWKAYFDGSEEIWSKNFSHVRFRASTKDCCQASKPIDGLLVPRDQRFQLPLVECDAAWCSCRWLQERI